MSITLIIILVFLYGVIVGHYQIFPFEILQNVKSFTNNPTKVSSPTVQDINVDSLISIKNEDDIKQKKNAIINYIWKENILPKSLPTQVLQNIDDSRYNDLNNLKRIDKLTTVMEYGISSTAYLFHPVNSNNMLIIYHAGHEGDFITGKNTIEYFLNKGFSVLAFSMPLVGMNNNPTVNLPNGEPIKLISHNQFVYLESSSFSPLKLFFQPIAASLNYLDDNYDFASYNMIGLSSGGWTTILYSAMDDRISQSFSVAGSLPLFLRTESRDLGDYEQNVPELYNIANYLDLYIMSAYGDGRKLVQIFNKYDSCCFAGENYKIYDDEIKMKMSQLKKGSFEQYQDDTHKEHKISDYALNIIYNSLVNSKIS